MHLHSEAAARRAQSSNGSSDNPKSVALQDYRSLQEIATETYPSFAIANRFGLTVALAAEVCRMAGFGIPTYDQKLENWKRAMLNLKGVLDRYGIEFPAIPEVGITGREISDVEMDDIIPVF